MLTPDTLSCFNIVTETKQPSENDMLNINDTFLSIAEAIADERNDARVEALTGGTTVRSRGVWLSGTDAEGETVSESEAYPFKSKRELLQAVDSLRRLGAVEFCIEGGFDAADCPHDMNCGDYLPWASDWAIELNVN